MGEGNRIFLGGFGEGHAWEFREMESCSAGKGGSEECKEERI